MIATLDAAGRIVVPKPLHLKPGMRLEVSERDGAILLQSAPVPMRVVRRGQLVAVEPDEPLPTLTADQVRDILESGRR